MVIRASEVEKVELVELVDEQGHVLGHMEKLAAHREGLLHRAFSVFVFDGRGELLLQQRAAGKYHSPGLWSNSCCGHPRPGEAVGVAARRRLSEELGFSCELTEVFRFIYRVELADGLIEHELDHVFVGVSDVAPRPDPTEVSAVRSISRSALTTELERAPTSFSSWLPLCAEQAWDAFERQVKG